MKVIVLGINGSPRIGNSQFLLECAIEGAREVNPESVTVSTYSFKKKTFKPCVACSYCVKNNGRCFQDDDFEELQNLWLKSDVIIYSVPVYHMSVPGQLKCFIDRLGNSMFGRFLPELPKGSTTLPKQLKVIASIAQGIHIFSGQEHTITDLINHALVMQCVPVTGDLWESYIGAAGWTANKIEKYCLRKLTRNGDMDANVAARSSKLIGRRSVELSLILQAGLLANESLLEKDPIYAYILDRVKRKEKGS